ncbi:phosphoenolpyruvate hydrolase family protein [Acidobacteria bacterium AH-259-O06]|nr:phosphoenolpyruvate hydrolase family protein [Acidobacteria bacterium AH-259-O06]
MANDRTRLSRKEILKRLKQQVSSGIPIIGAGAGTGISAKCAQAGGADLIVIYNSGRFRMAGHGSLSGLMPYGDANSIVLEMAREVLPVTTIPVLAGVCGTDPFRLMHVFLRDVRAMGFNGVQNFPTVGLIDGIFRQNLEETGMSYSKEIKMIGLANELDLLTTPYVFNVDEAVEMTKVGADVLVAHMGLTTKGTIGARTAKTLDQCVREIQAIHDAAKEVRDDIFVICHGGPLSEPQDVDYLLKKTRGVVGFFGASSVERLPTEQAITARVSEFKQIKLEEI